MRRPAVLIATATLVVASAAAVVSGPPAAAASTVPGTYVATTPTRVLDTRNGAYGNRKGAVAANRGVAVRVTGTSRVPSGAAAVAVTITVVSATRSGGITASTYGVRSRPGVTNVQFVARGTATGMAVVKPTSGRVDLWNASSGSVQLVMDVVGYYVGGTAKLDGALHTFTPKRAVDTRSGLHGFHHGALGAGKSLAANLHALAGLPANAGAVAATVTVLSPTRAGSLVAYATGTTRPAAPLLDFTAGRAVSQFAILPISDVQGLTLYNASGGSVQVVVDVQGYLGAGSAAIAAGHQVVAANRVYSDSYLPARGTDSVPVLGRGGVPRAGVAAVAVAVRVRKATRSGGVVGSTRAAPVIASFGAGQSVSGTVLLPVVRGAVTIRNTTTGHLGLEVDVLGYVPSSTITAPVTPTAARYPNDLTTDIPTDQAVMTAHGTADAAATFALLDLGAQTIHAPLSPSGPGIALALTGSDPVRLAYGDIVTVVKAYIDGLATGGHPVTLAVGTNNDGDWTGYPANTRGLDFAELVIGPLASYGAPKGVTVVGADDIEANFGSRKAADALAWESAYFGATTADLEFNGALIDCPTVFGSGATCGFGWTQQQYAALTKHVEAGRNRTQVLPQVYFAVQAVQWADIAATAGGLTFAGSLTQHAADATTYTPAQGWAALVRALQWRVTSPSVPLAVDIGPDA